MSTPTADDLSRKKCLPCEGGVPTLTPDEARAMLERVDGWELIDDGKAIRRAWTVKHFRAAKAFFDEVADLAEAEQHHPDIHVTGYRNVAIELTTHAIGGLSENDFILAAKIDRLPIKLKSQTP